MLNLCKSWIFGDSMWIRLQFDKRRMAGGLKPDLRGVFIRFSERAIRLRADFFRASAFGGFNGKNGPAALRTRFIDWLIPDGIVAFGISRARVEYFSTP